MNEEVKKYMRVLKNKFYRKDNVMYPAWFADRMMAEAYEDFDACNINKVNLGEKDV